MAGVDPKLLEILVCPLCKGKLFYRKAARRARMQGRSPRLPGEGRHPGDAGGGGAQAPAGRRSRLELPRHHPGALRVDAVFRASRSPTSAGKPMVVRVCERAAQSGAAAVHVATDDERIAAAVRGARASRCVMTRADHPSGTDRWPKPLPCSDSRDATSWSTCRATSR